ncbi:Nse1 non-SMC component of SMC5-6 complex-domain-containing protein [Syncephalis pseudoplumigaleata]|uniref:Non-structural maintenance of chromosomes element 1 homolog n=1 Tax=Syncephalis pseudoplumigaleata TaxID=1712513 RepID=A0A4P9YWE3_9FUNG|nr:Nse1 non-SMC component of SMC5-6 complex-domain-containing protein [Syncephalis pseudoplumigaleata]|eukprot:RKP24337.1 Nse1 non-SMC component of SMC5-6 complex-domain-containing protein [Syncephalis pseudoplumigaleata]
MNRSSMTNTHRAFLQACMATQLFTEDEAHDLYRRVCEATQVPYHEERLLDFMADLNRGIDKYDLEFRKAANEDTGEICWALVNTNGDRIAQYATGYSSQELQYFKKIPGQLDKMIRSEHELYALSSIQALNDSPTTMTRVQTEALLNRFVTDGWLSYASSHGQYGLGIRTLLELQTLLKDEYSMIKECTLCMDTISKGERCDDVRCDARLHYHCARRYFRPDAPHKCPACQKPWSHAMHIGPQATAAAATTPSTATRTHRHSQGHNQPSTPASSQAPVVLIDEDEEEEQVKQEEDEEDISPLRRSSKRLRH